ncbi:MAG TPA: symmetrical bis(5'-nucleosyl)-tetraphosphatase [Pseudomonadales bacterium]|jgi:bis(5'-nucleosyl)-tetraphosphatase (symmetrical)
MNTWVVGDVQGCFGELMRVLTQARFDPDRDCLWSVGDLVNRGPESLATLRFFYQLGDHARIVLGNHDLHLLAVAEGIRPVKRHDTLQAILDAPDAAELLGWLRQQPLLLRDDASHSLMVHAGIPPCWDVATAEACAAEISATLQSTNCRDLLEHMYGDEPDCWQDTLAGMPRQRLIINYFTRMRFCDAHGRLELNTKEAANAAPAGFAPWFSHPNAALRDWHVYFGHWAALMGHCPVPNRHALDTGCVWGQHLTLQHRDTGQTVTAQRDEVPGAGQ